MTASTCRRASSTPSTTPACRTWCSWGSPRRPRMTETSYDLIVCGAGAGGMTAAVVAAAEGLRVLLLEETGLVGGTTAWSGGMVWTPANWLTAAIGQPDTPEAARRYLRET